MENIKVNSESRQKSTDEKSDCKVITDVGGVFQLCQKQNGCRRGGGTLMANPEFPLDRTINEPTQNANYKMCGHKLWPRGNTWICVLEEEHGGKHNHWPAHLVNAQSTSITLEDKNA